MVAAAVLPMPDVLVTTYLHMTSKAQFQPAFVNLSGITIERMQTPDVKFYRFLYDSVGEAWRWRDRRLMTDDELHAAIADPNVSVHVLYVGGTPAGYVELSKSGGETEIAYFGLRPNFMGMGLGKHLLSYGIDQAWRDGAKRLFVHTCNLDSPVALSNYRKRGFQVYQELRQPMPQRYC